ncbi:hypothetical protein K9L27_04575 [Candidatus Gracilibacteria bacterium]|nr:hypothetical protein [Candidatus Gracilibacteria bacterium]
MKKLVTTASVFLIPLFSMGIVFAQEDMGEVPLPPQEDQMMMNEEMPPEQMMQMREARMGDMEQMDEMSPEDFQMMRAAMHSGMMKDRMESGKMNYTQQIDDSNYSGKKGIDSSRSKYSQEGHRNWGTMILWKLGKVVGGVVILFIGTFVVRKSWDFAGKSTKKK